MKYKTFLTIQEATYAGNIGFSEMVSFYKKATYKEIDEMEKLVSSGNWSGFKSLIKKVLGIDLEENKKPKGQIVVGNWNGDTINLINYDDEEEEE